MSCSIRRDHPRTRGEKQTATSFSPRRLGSPPHARGKGRTIRVLRSRFRITPARAGKRAPEPLQYTCPEDHPRTRGEKVLLSPRRYRSQGSPPHARGKDRLFACVLYRNRITPARAGKRAGLCPLNLHSRDHPRTRGEKQFNAVSAEAVEGSPPHARGKVSTGTNGSTGGRITPARAGKSP